ncbi:MAG: FimB/Mfa2 family fimbrial subunit, partial [Tannerella sp.]|nr:FimB/Mfa2 family fimbrial subunit [Tannerella sp.]
MTRMILLFCIFFLPLTACISDEQAIVDDRPVEREARVSFSLMLPSRQMQTRAALSEADENAIHTVRLLMFKEANGLLTYCFGVNGNNIREGLSMQTISFDVQIPTGTYDVVVLANAQTIIDNSNITLGDAKEDVLGALVEIGAGKWNGRAIPMWGRTDRLTVSTTAGLSNNSDIEMIRMVAKIDVEIASSAAGDFTLTDIRLYNYSSQGALVPDLTSWPAGNLAVAPTQPSVAGGYGTVSTPLVFDAGDGLTTTGCERIIYAFEAPAGSEATPAGNTCLVIGGSYRGGATTYYKVDFAGRENEQPVFLPLLRNSYYLIKVVAVSNSGYASPATALSLPSANMNTLLLQWTEKGMNNVVFDGKYMLGVSASRVTLPGDAYSVAGTDNKLTILSTVPAGWEIERITDASGAPGTAPWLTLSRMSGAVGAAEEVFIYTEKNTS